MRGLVLALGLAGTLACRGSAAPPPRWVASWGAAQMVPGPNDQLKPMAGGVTVRERVRLSIGGSRFRVRLSNVFGTQPLVIDAAAIARATPGSARIGGATSLTFDGAPAVTIPAGAEAYSDPVATRVADGADLAISFHLPALPAVQTGHPGARSITFLAAGNEVSAPDLPGAATAERWWQIADVEVVAGPNAAAVVAIGDSITDGHAVVTDTDGRWTDRLAERLRAAGGPVRWGVVNAGIGGNGVLGNGLGPNLVSRFDRDVIARAGVRTAIVLEGINDLGGLARADAHGRDRDAELVRQLEDAFRQIVARAHVHGIAVIGGTIMPFTGSGYYHPGPQDEANRQAVNAFIRTSGTFDGVIDFDRTMRDPDHPERLLPAYDSGDHLHPGPVGYRAMGDAVPLALLSVRPHALPPALGAAAAVPLAPAADAGPAIALTFDDLPAHGPLPPGETRLQVVDALIAALRAEHAPAFGFVSGAFGADDPQSPAVLRAWRAAGLPLGNHTFSHGDLNRIPANAWQADVVRNEAVIAPLMAGQDWHWLRYPFLSEGASPAERDAVRAFLRARGYRIAAVTMSFGDYGWNEPYARCVAKGNAAAVAGLEGSYLAAARSEAERERALSRGALGRDVPYVLLMHAGAFDARMLPRLLAQYRAMGFRFVPLAQAEADPFYRAATDLSVPGPSPNLAAAAAAKGVPVPPGPALPAADLCR